MQVPEELSYTEEHEWIKAEDGGFRVGITDYAQDQLGDIVYVDLPEPGSGVEKGAVIAEVESTKSVGEVYAPFSGTVTSVNEPLEDRPELVNQDPYGEGWLVVIETDAALDGFLDADAYRGLTE
jgi:glycine cleavage system H protein